METPSAIRIAVLIPCFNEEISVAKVVRDFRLNLPNAVIFVYDNNSTDRTAKLARAAGAEVVKEALQGKGNVIRRMFADIEADVYVLVDGDDTYDAACVGEMVNLLLDEQLDMVNGKRTENGANDEDPLLVYRRGHRLGNRLLSDFVRAIFGDRIRDMLSGYRVFSRRFVKSFPALVSGFETETELTIHALNLMMPIAEFPVGYRQRPAGSESKLRTYSDGLRILKTIIVLIKEERPLQFFTAASVTLFVIGIALGTPVVTTYLKTGLVPRLPTAVLAVGIVLLSFVSLSSGLILDSVARARNEAKRFAYLSIPRWHGGR
jgi:glycosyltransferase involved in cell wall biosynthesis